MTSISGRSLVEELRQVVAPASTGFAVRDVPGAPGYRIGRGADNVVALLTPADPQPEPPTRLRTLQLAPSVRATLEDLDGSVTEAEHGLVQLVLDDPGVFEPFMGVAATVIRLLGPDPAPGTVSTAMRRLVRIFDPAQQPRGSVLGLWAELLVVLASNDAPALLDAWHAHVDAAFDFAAEGSRLEVKATTQGERVHAFNLRQLKPVPGAEVVIASVMTTETHAGTSVSELVERLEHRLAGDAPRQMVLHSQVSDTLGSDWSRHLGRRFDEQQGLESLVLLHPGDVPQVEDPPAAVVDVRLTVDCTEVPPLAPSTGLGALLRSRTRS